MTPSEYREEFIATLGQMDPTGLIPPFIRAHLIAKTMQEVPTWDGRGISNLAARYNNLFGINAPEGSPGVTLEGNPIDKSQGRPKVTYKVYGSWPESILDAVRHLFSSGHYIPAYFDFLGRAERIWATNPTHAQEVAAKFIHELDLMTDSQTRRGMYHAAYSDFLGKAQSGRGGVA